MTNHELRQLPEGSIIRNTGSGSVYIVVEKSTSGFPIVSRTLLVHNGPEWELAVPNDIEALKESRAVAIEQEQVSRNEANRLRTELAELKRKCRQHFAI